MLFRDEGSKTCGDLGPIMKRPRNGCPKKERKMRHLRRQWRGIKPRNHLSFPILHIQLSPRAACPWRMAFHSTASN